MLPVPSTDFEHMFELAPVSLWLEDYSAVRRLFEQVEISPAMSAAAKDAKTALQEWLQARKMRLPQYEVVRVLGAAHRQTFEVRCQVAELNLEVLGQGASRRAAEQCAAASMLEQLQNRP